MQYYIIDDLRLPPKRTFHKGWTMERFPSLQEALARYRALPSRQAKSLGMTDGIHVLELARHVLIYPAETAWEDVQAARPELLPLWAEIPEATAAAEDCISALNLRYQLSGSVVTPVPSRDRLRRDLRDKYLWLSGESGQETALRWVYIVGAGWKQPAFLRQWKRTGHPLVLRCQADGLTEQGAYILLETLPWEYDVLMRRTLEQREREAERIEYSHEQSSMQLNTRTYLPKAEQQVQSGPKIGGLGEIEIMERRMKMRRAMMLCAAVLCLTMTLAPTALAAGTNEVEICYPTAITQSEDGTELRKLYDLGPEDDPTGIPRSDFEQDGFHYTLTDLLRQELPEHDERQHTETVSLQSANKDMASILALLPQEKEFITEDGYMGTLSLQLDTVQVEVSGYGSSTREISATRSYPNLANQDTSNIPKTIQDNGRTLTLQTINWQTDNTATLDGYALGDRFTAVATYTGSATSSYVKGYTVTADYTGTVGKINLDRVRYVAIFEGTPLQPVEEVPAAAAFSWAVLLVPIGMVALVGAVAGAALFIRHRREHEPVEENEV